MAWEGQPPFGIFTLDVSPGGVGISLTASLAAKQRCQIQFNLPLNGKSHRIAAVGVVTHCVCGGSEGFKAGLKFVEIDEASKNLLASYMKQD